MSAQVYPAQSHQRFHPTGPTSRRHPFANAANQQATPPKPQEKPKQPGSPPLPRQNSKTTPPSPPKIITDRTGYYQLHRVGFLGEGGFARVYEVKDTKGARLACKVITKTSLKTKKAKTKLYAEIKIHRALEHPNIVRFQECFEDDDNVYMTLELCPSGSLMDLLRHRRRFTEPEARFYMVQLIGACHYMHTHQVIHRDLKLGNLFLDANMNVKVGDFGLAALIESPGERKKTICGTPNYIAPEVLFDTANGHSFEVDTWSIGVILYTLVVGRPPFQTKDVKDIYKRIRDNQYEFPPERSVSSHSQHLIQQILTSDPQLRPTLHDIVDHPFFTQGIVPSYIPTSAHDAPPNFRHITRPVSEANLKRLRRFSLLDDDQMTYISVPKAPTSSSGSEAPAAPAKSMTSSIAQQEKEFQKAAALLMGTANTNGNNENPLLRKLQAVKESPLGRRPVMRAVNGVVEESGDGVGSRVRDDQDDQMRSRKKELESQKARIVAQMAPVREEDDDMDVVETLPRTKIVDRENMPPRTQMRERQKAVGKDLPALPGSGLLNGFDAAAQILSLAFDAKASGKLFRDPREDAHLPLPNERVFIVSWVDYCNKYGMGYALTDGSVGVHFNDSTTLVLSPDKQKSHHIYMDRLYGEYEYTFEDVGRSHGMEWVQKYLRMKHVIVFKLSHDVLQFNFYDHSKVILSSHGLLITHIDKNYKMTRWTLSDVMALSLQSPANMDQDQAKFNQRLVDKLKYCKEVLISIRTASANGVAVPEEGGPIEPMASNKPGPTVAVSARSSKTSLR
ncbi:kinase-like domain-containing protein [Infundibulicybe gibba]|nr:kinase-like domain-containing protein [Infundibulicybe gibba]